MSSPRHPSPCFALILAMLSAFHYWLPKSDVESPHYASGLSDPAYARLLYEQYQQWRAFFTEPEARVVAVSIVLRLCNPYVSRAQFAMQLPRYR